MIPKRKKSIKNINANISITGSVFIALALIVVLGIAVGTAFNEIKAGMGNPSFIVAAIAFIVLIIIALAIGLSRR